MSSLKKAAQSPTPRPTYSPRVAALIVVICLATPGAASCQSSQTNTDRGTNELKALVDASNGKPAPADLVRIESKYPKTRAASLARFLRGFSYHSAQNCEAALDALDAKIIGANSSLVDYALFYRAECEAATGSKDDALGDYRMLYSKHADSIKARESRLRASELAIASGDPSFATKELDAMAEASDADAILLIARAYEAMGKNQEALKLYQRLYFDLPATAASAEAELRLEALGALTSDARGSYDEQRSRADRLFEANRYAEAAEAYADLFARFPERDKDDEIQLRLGVSLVRNNQPAQAVLPLTKVSARDPALHAEALFNQAEALRRSNRAAEAASLVDALLRKHARSRWAEVALYNLATYLNKEGRTAEAVLRYGQLLSAYPKSEYAPEASYQTGWQSYQAKRYGDAARIFSQHLASYRYPLTKYIGEAAFWAGRAEERLGRRTRALLLYDLVSERYRYGYHGYVAALRAKSLRAANPSLKPEPAPPGSELERIKQNVLYIEGVRETADGSETKRIAKADDLEIIGLGDLAIRELNRALEAAPLSLKLNLRLAQVYSHRGDSFQATLVLRRAYPDLYSYRDSDLPREAWEIFFPLVEWETIKDEARRNGIDPYLAAGLIRQESVFNPNAVSRVGARGLMQLMPATGQLVAKRQGNGRITPADLFNPTLNIKLGMSYLAQMLGEFGRIEYAAAAYNAGPARARRWLAERGSLDIEEWIETIPFAETRGYVQSVLRYAANYRRFYKE